MSLIPDSHKDLLLAPTTITLATLMPDGQPQTTAIWFYYQNDTIYILTGKGSQKHKNLLNDNRATLLVLASDNPFRYIELRGTCQLYEDYETVLKYRKALFAHYDRPTDMNEEDVKKRLVAEFTPHHVNAHG